MIDGTTQPQRLPAAMVAPGFQVDELGFEQLLAMTQELAARLKFIDVDDREHGRWSEMFAGDPVAVMAQLLSLDVKRLQADFLEEVDTLPVAQLVRQVADFDERIQGWLESLPEALKVALGEGVEHLIQPPALQALGRLRSFAEGAPVRPAASAAEEAQQRQRLRNMYFALVGALRRMQALAREQLPRSLASGTEPAAIALLVGFLRAFGQVQQRINGFSDRHVEFYYRDCLHMAARRARPDQVHLLLQRDPQFGPEVQVPAGTRFVAGQGEDGRPIEFAADQALPLGDARVVALVTLRQERDRLISPECVLGYVTGVKAARLAMGTAPVQGWPAFGGSVPGSPGAAQRARLGLAVSSPVLWLEQGERRIRVALRLQPGEPIDDAVQGLFGPLTETGFDRQCGRLFARWLLHCGHDERPEHPLFPLRPAQLAAVRERVAQWGRPAPQPALDRGDTLSLLYGTQLPERELLFEQLMCHLFVARLSVADGWREVSQAVLRRGQAGVDGQRPLEMSLLLAPEHAPLAACTPAVHGAEWNTTAPVLSLTLNPQARLFSLSLLEVLNLTGVDIAVDVRGVEDLRVHNQLGQVDPTKPFMPFGPLPSRASYLVVGSPEAARKSVDAMVLRFDWGGLPLGPGGFAEHYEGYGPGWHNRVFRVTPSILRDGQWQEALGDDGPPSLFAAESSLGRLWPQAALAIDRVDLRTRWRPDPEATLAGPQVRQGLVKLQLREPDAAFGHAAYPELLTRALTAQARSKQPLPLPTAPYTPLLERLRLDYRASTSLRFAGSVAARNDASERVLHLHPFGLDTVYPSRSAGVQSLLPRFDGDGQLFIGLNELDPSGRLTLWFDLREEAASDPVAVGPGGTPGLGGLRWSALVEGRWQPLASEQLVGDTTLGLRTRGVVTLELPEGMTRGHPSLPGDCFWLRIATDQPAARFAGLCGVRAHALVATRVMADGLAAAAPLPPQRVSRPSTALPGVQAVEQPAASFGERAPETAAARRTRIGERLRHKQRATVPWDYERLVLGEFPEVYKVKCFANLDSPSGQTRAGRVLVVVVPRVPRNDPAVAALAQKLNAVKLAQIREFLEPLASPFTRVTVRNPAWERIQVRCRVRLATGQRNGAMLRRVQQALIEYLSPWFDGGHDGRFQWALRGAELEVCLRKLPEVEAVHGLSLLRLTEDEAAYHRLDDTAPPSIGAPGGTVPLRSVHLQARWPWSLALPMHDHLIEMDRDEARPDRPLRTGVDRLAVGSTFVIGSRG